MPRLFIAIKPPEEVTNQLDRLCRGLPDARWTDIDDFHLTLRFVGEVDHPRFCEIGEGLMSVNMLPFELQFADLGTFPKGMARQGIRQIWAGVAPCQSLSRLRPHWMRPLTR